DRCDIRARQSSLRSPRVQPTRAQRLHANPTPELSSQKVRKARVRLRDARQLRYSPPCASFRSRAKSDFQKSSRYLRNCLQPALPAPYPEPACPLQTRDIPASLRPLHSISSAHAPAFYEVLLFRQPRPLSAATRLWLPDVQARS